MSTSSGPPGGDRAELSVIGADMAASLVRFVRGGLGRSISGKNVTFPLRECAQNMLFIPPFLSMAMFL